MIEYSPNTPKLVYLNLFGTIHPPGKLRRSFRACSGNAHTSHDWKGDYLITHSLDNRLTFHLHSSRSQWLGSAVPLISVSIQSPTTQYNSSRSNISSSTRLSVSSFMNERFTNGRSEGVLPEALSTAPSFACAAIRYRV
jgi:hypothetical protein